ncbi:MAG: hypothetical protein IV100_09355 [Myxococcales bacterium]|nr:hypothetical protein [Myxococcales bacterium]
MKACFLYGIAGTAWSWGTCVQQMTIRFHTTDPDTAGPAFTPAEAEMRARSS